MADVITRFKLETTQYDSKLRDASKGLAEYTRQATKAGNEFGKFTQSNVEAARALGAITPSANNAKDKVKELVGAFNDAAKAYNSLTKEQQQSDFGKAMAGSIEQLNDQLKLAKQELYGMGDAMNKAGGGGLFSGMGDKMSGALQVFAGNMLTKAAGAVASLGSEMVGMVQQGVELAKQGEGIRIAFERLGRGDILNGLREATHGTVTDLELMKAAVKFNDFKLPLDELGTMLAFAQQKAKDTGQSVDYMVESITNGLGRQSKLILDNLGISAKEIEERMKSTGDFTKAVGEIIRDQMKAAGDYIETAADRATQADVKLKNAMEDLGRTFEPLTSASGSLWNSIKVGALNALNTAVKPLIQALSEAGALGAGARSSAGFNNLGGNSKVDRMIGRLGNGKTAGSYSIYQQQLGEFDKYINNKRFQIAAYGGDNSSVAQSAKERLQTELDGALKMRAEYVKRAQELHNQVPSPYEPARTSGGGSGSGKGDVGGPSMPKNIRWDNYADKAALAATKGVDTMPSVAAMITPESIFGNTDDWENYKDVITGGIGSIGEKMDNLKEWTKDFDPYADKMKEIATASNQQKAAFDLAAQAAGSLNTALSSMEDPAAKAAGTVISAIANIALGFATASAQAGALGPFGWIAWLAAGAAALATTISTVHSLTGYSEGGIVGGNSYSGDNIFAGNAMLNSGEVVLTRAMAGNLASQLEGNGLGNLNLSATISGEQIRLALNNNGRRTGRGEYVQTNFR